MNLISPVGGQTPPKPKPAPVSQAATVSNTTDMQAKDPGLSKNGIQDDEAKAARQEAKAALEKALKDDELSQKILDEISRDLETLHSVSLDFSRHEKTGRTMVKVLNKETDEVIREIPSEKILDMAAKIGEMVGLLFDEKV